VKDEPPTLDGHLELHRVRGLVNGLTVSVPSLVDVIVQTQTREQIHEVEGFIGAGRRARNLGHCRFRDEPTSNKDGEGQYRTAYTPLWRCHSSVNDSPRFDAATLVGLACSTMKLRIRVAKWPNPARFA